MKGVFSIIITILFFISCVNNNEIKKDLKILQSKRITFPADTKLLVHGEDTVINNFMDSELKLVIYIDSVNCGPCLIDKMFLWDDFLEYAEKFDNRLKYYFIFSPKKNDEYGVRIALIKASSFDYPVILDSKWEFEKLNPHLPKNKVMHTFLLDKYNKVIFVGNPLNSTTLEEMFYKIVEERLGKK